MKLSLRRVGLVAGVFMMAACDGAVSCNGLFFAVEDVDPGLGACINQSALPPNATSPILITLADGLAVNATNPDSTFTALSLLPTSQSGDLSPANWKNNVIVFQKLILDVNGIVTGSTPITNFTTAWVNPGVSNAQLRIIPTDPDPLNSGPYLADGRYVISFVESRFQLASGGSQDISFLPVDFHVVSTPSGTTPGAMKVVVGTSPNSTYPVSGTANVPSRTNIVATFSNELCGTPLATLTEARGAPAIVNGSSITNANKTITAGVELAVNATYTLTIESNTPPLGSLLAGAQDKYGQYLTHNQSFRGATTTGTCPLCCTDGQLCRYVATFTTRPGRIDSPLDGSVLDTTGGFYTVTGVVGDGIAQDRVQIRLVSGTPYATIPVDSLSAVDAWSNQFLLTVPLSDNPRTPRRIELLVDGNVVDAVNVQACGNGVIDLGESCDDGNTLDCVGTCDETCSLAITYSCGNGTLECGEECDDGNTASGDGCGSTCRRECTSTGPCPPGSYAEQIVGQQDDFISINSLGKWLPVCNSNCNLWVGTCTGQQPKCYQSSGEGTGALSLRFATQSAQATFQIWILGFRSGNFDTSFNVYIDGVLQTPGFDGSLLPVGVPQGVYWQKVGTVTLNSSSNHTLALTASGGGAFFDGYVFTTDTGFNPGVAYGSPTTTPSSKDYSGLHLNARDYYFPGPPDSACCGDCIMQANEECDTGTSTVTYGGCTSSCLLRVCGNGRKEGAEICDDGNLVVGDGCSATCTVEPGWTCAGTAPSVCTLRCGNGVLEAGEVCDDGNNNDCTGTCNAACTKVTGCGDGIVCAPEICDDGTGNRPNTPGYCKTDCSGIPGPSFYQDVRPILGQRCFCCHTGNPDPNDETTSPCSHEGFLVTRYDDVFYQLLGGVPSDPSSPFRHLVLGENPTGIPYMPPWPPGPQSGGCPPLKDAKNLTPAELAVLQQWVTIGAPEGNPNNKTPIPMPPDPLAGLPNLPGNPLSADFGYDFAPDFMNEGTDPYWCTVLPASVPGANVIAIGLEPGNEEIVHHATIYRIPGGAVAGAVCGNNATELGEVCDDGNTSDGDGCPSDCKSKYGCGNINPGGELIGAWVPGQKPLVLPPGVGFQMSSNDLLGVQIHYHVDTADSLCDGAPCTDNSRVKLWFQTVGMPVTQFAQYEFFSTNVPTIYPYQTVSTTSTDRWSCSNCTCGQPIATLLAVFPHMHLLGHEFDAIRLPYGQASPDCLLHIPSDHWDFGWQLMYQFENPITLTACDNLQIECTWKNEKNEIVTGGSNSNEEMCSMGALVIRDPGITQVPCCTPPPFVFCNSFCRRPPICGDGFQELTELCDDGNTVSGDGCSALCGTEFCGDGVIDIYASVPEVCDDGNLASGDGCDGNCQCENPSVCGDGNLCGAEFCDEGTDNRIGEGHCWADCTHMQTCGDGYVSGGTVLPGNASGELCDTGDAGCDWSAAYCQADGTDCDICPPSRPACNPASPTCEFYGKTCQVGCYKGFRKCESCRSWEATPVCDLREYCGDGIKQSCEVCDDGNKVAGDGCSIDCQSLGCGDGFLDSDGPNNIPGDFDDEKCDDGNLSDTDDCPSTCRPAECGDGFVDEQGPQKEACDDGKQCADGFACTQHNQCGAHTIGFDRWCRTRDGLGDGFGTLVVPDGCSENCLSDQSCGNGYVDAGLGEVCDDGNSIYCDGCSGDCHAPEGSCGDGSAYPFCETCDDKNAVSGDGCSNWCTRECDCAGRFSGVGYNTSCGIPSGSDMSARGVAYQGPTADKGPTAYVADFNGSLRVIDVSNPTSPSQSLSCPISEGNPWSVALDSGSNLAVVAAGANGRGESVTVVVNTENCISTLVPTEDDDPPGSSSRSVAVHGGYAYVANGNGGLRIFQVSSPDPIIKDFDLPGNAVDLAYGGGYVYLALAQTGIAIVDVDANNDSMPDDPQLLSVLDTGSASGVALDPSDPTTVYVFVADTATPCGPPFFGFCGALAAVDVTNKAIPSLTAYRTTSDFPHDLVAQGNHVYLANDGDGLAVLFRGFLSDPPVLRHQASYNTFGTAWNVAVDSLENYAYVASGTAGLEIIRLGASGCLTAPTCGDGYRDGSCTLSGEACNSGPKPCPAGQGSCLYGEVCDDGNNLSGDGCSLDCRSDESCGNGYVDTAKNELCDDGNAADDCVCLSNCQLPGCGDGIPCGEPCDDGNNGIQTDACLDGCVKAYCGDGHIINPQACGGALQPFCETCDLGEENGKNVGPGTCNANCSGENYCGDGIITGEEKCDDGNTGDCVPGATLELGNCNHDCTVIVTGCGDGVKCENEACDDGNVSDCTGTCRGDCLATTGCGDAKVCGAEVCDDGNVSDCTGTCRGDCLATTGCGDAKDCGAEECDDGNTSDFDACLSTCIRNECGDGHALLIGCGGSGLPACEECDDGNNSNHDICTTECTIADCGDGYIWSENCAGNNCESCDSGANNGAHDQQCPNDYCNDSCAALQGNSNCCGNSVPDTGEGCDTGNQNGATECGCQASCQYTDYGTPCTNTNECAISAMGNCETNLNTGERECDADQFKANGTWCQGDCPTTQTCDCPANESCNVSCCSGDPECICANNAGQCTVDCIYVCEGYNIGGNSSQCAKLTWNDYISPLFNSNDYSCVGCHSPTVWKDECKADKCGGETATEGCNCLSLQSYTELVEGGKSGSGINLLNPENSILYQRINSTNADFKMPPGTENLTILEKKRVLEWIRLGAPVQ